MQKILIYFTVVERKITAPFQQHSISDKCKHKSRLLQYDLLHYLQRVMLRGFYDRTAIHGHIEMLSAVTQPHVTRTALRDASQCAHTVGQTPAYCNSNPPYDATSRQRKQRMRRHELAICLGNLYIFVLLNDAVSFYKFCEFIRKLSWPMSSRESAGDISHGVLDTVILNFLPLTYTVIFYRLEIP